MVDRDEVEKRIAQRLSALDDATLMQVEALTRSPAGELEQPGAATPPASPGVSRRQLLAILGTGGIALVGTNVATGLLAGTRGTQLGELKASAAAELELARLRGLLALYENLERIGIDLIILAAIGSLGLALGGLSTAARTLRDAVAFIDTALKRFEASLPTIQDGLKAAESLAQGLGDRLAALRNLFSEATKPTQPLADALGEFMERLLDLLPGSVGDRIRQGLSIMRDLLAGLPAALDTLQNQLLAPLRATWFREDSGVQAGLFSPLRSRLLAPLNDFLTAFAGLTDQWERELVQPVQQALQEREDIRAQIAEYKRQHNL